MPETLKTRCVVELTESDLRALASHWNVKKFKRADVRQWVDALVRASISGMEDPEDES